MSLDSLPSELVAEIAKLLESEDLQTLRLVNSGVTHIVDPILFENVLVDLKIQDPDSVLDFLRSAGQNGLISKYARSTKFVSIRVCTSGSEAKAQNEVEEESQVIDGEFKATLQQAIRGLTNATSIRVECPKDPTWIPETIFEGAFQLQSLSEISYDHYSSTPISWPSTPYADILTRFSLGAHWALMTSAWIRELGSFVSRFPNLEAFSLSRLSHPYAQLPLPDCSFSELIASIPKDHTVQVREVGLHYFVPILRNDNIGFLRSLTALTLLNVPPCFVDTLSTSYPDDNTVLNSFWVALSIHHIHLRKIIIDGITASFFKYLSSYSGLQSLELRDRPGCFLPTASGFFVDNFIRKVMPKHNLSLLHFAVDTGDQDLWNFNLTWAAALLECEVLQSLSVCLSYSPFFVEQFNSFINALLDCATHLNSLRKVSVTIVYNNDDYNHPPDDPADWPNANNRFTLGYHADWAEDQFIATVKQFETGSLEHRKPLELYLSVDYLPDPWVLTKTGNDIWHFIMTD